MLCLGNGRTGYIWVTEGHVTFGLWKDMLHLGNRRTGYIWVKEGHVTFGLWKDMLHLGNRRSCYIWGTEGRVTSIYDSYYPKLPTGPRFLVSVSDLKF